MADLLENVQHDVDEYEWWRTAKDHPEWIGTDRLPIHEGHPNLGYYRVHNKRTDKYEAVAFFRDPDSGILQAERNGRAVPEKDVNDLWIWACRHPIEYEAWEDGNAGKWADEPERAPGIGDNIRDADPQEALRIEYLGEKETIDDFLNHDVETQEQADRVGIWHKRLTNIRTRADALHAGEKAPILAEGRRVDDRWRWREELTEVDARLKAHVKPFMDEQDRKEAERVAAAKREHERLQAEARRKLDEAAAEERRRNAEAERQKREAERLANEGKFVEAKQAERAAEAELQQADRAISQAGQAVADMKEAERAAVRKNVAVGRTNAKLPMKNFTSATVTDWLALLTALQDREEIRAVAQQIANKAAKAGFALPGCEITKERRPG